jgi:molybdopterin/thiamine biosynthesis adenylyltransferase
LPRGGANTSFQNKRIAIVGCGAVGGQIAFHLIQSGILDLTLIDHDIFTYENTFRNPLGKQFVDETKVEGLRRELESKYPYVKIKAVALRVEEAVSKSILDMEKFDLVIMATGDDNVSLMINKFFNTKGIRLPILYSWLEPYGIGGHVLVANIDGKGCFQCLFTPMQPYGEFSNRASFVAPGQAFTKDIAGCANRFTPFGSLDAGNTASLAVRLSLKVLSGKITTNALYSWRGESDDLADSGFQVSDRFINFDFAVTNNGVKVYNPNCPVCGS